MIFGDPITVILRIPALLWGISLHEFLHAFAAKMVGDPTAERQGRLTLNPLVHLDLFGSIMILLVGIGWARPVMINMRYFRNPQRDIVIVALAGVVGNILTVVVSVLLFRYMGFRLTGGGLVLDYAGMNSTAGRMLLQMILVNVALTVLNLLPIPPLDGSKVLYAFLPFRALGYYYSLERYGMIILIVLLVTGLIRVIFDPIFIRVIMLLM